PKVSGGTGDERKQLMRQLVIVVDVHGKRLVATDAFRFAVRFDVAMINSAHSIVEPGRLSRTEPLCQGREIVLEHVWHTTHAELREALLESRADERDVREIERGEKPRLVAGRDDMDARRARPGLRFGAFDGELRDELGRTSADGYGERR